MKVIWIGLCLCLAAGASLAQPGESAADFDSLKQQLRDTEERERRKAVQGLAALGSEEAWGLVLRSLEDTAGRVADQAQLEISRLPRGMQSDLLGKAGIKSRAKLVPLRIAEALGRMESAMPEESYLEVLGHRDPEVLRSALWSVERLAESGLLSAEHQEVAEAVASIIERHKDSRLRAQALVALADLSPELARPLVVASCKSKYPEERAAGIESCQLLPDEDRLRSVEALSTDEAFIVRLRCYEALAFMGTRDSMGALVAALQVEDRARLFWRVVSLLQECSGLKHGRDPRPWIAWHASLPENWTVAERHQSTPVGAELTASFVGVKLLSDRLAFVIDFSGSMWEVRQGKTRKERVDVEVRKALEALEEDVLFNLHPFNQEPTSWEKQLTRATPRKVKDAVDSFVKCKLRGGGDYWEALMNAMRDPALDTLVLLGDGAPSRTARWNIQLMKELFRHENRFRGIFLDVLLVDSSGGLTRAWREMSEASGGRCVSVEL